MMLIMQLGRQQSLRRMKQIPRYTKDNGIHLFKNNTVGIPIM